MKYFVWASIISAGFTALMAFLLTRPLMGAGHIWCCSFKRDVRNRWIKPDHKAWVGVCGGGVRDTLVFIVCAGKIRKSNFVMTKIISTLVLISQTQSQKSSPSLLKCKRYMPHDSLPHPASTSLLVFSKKTQQRAVSGMTLAVTSCGGRKKWSH